MTEQNKAKFQKLMYHFGEIKISHETLSLELTLKTSQFKPYIIILDSFGIAVGFNISW